mmetsp:Transcript_81471/g.174498  ORF Transcript_81471/g.174498 Transcript_81471/m.174498 type:complete len:244 (-) Transcript_81471:13-744(-)
MDLLRPAAASLGPGVQALQVRADGPELAGDALIPRLGAHGSHRLRSFAEAYLQRSRLVAGSRALPCVGANTPQSRRHTTALVARLPSDDPVAAHLRRLDVPRADGCPSAPEAPRSVLEGLLHLPEDRALPSRIVERLGRGTARFEDGRVPVDLPTLPCTERPCCGSQIWTSGHRLNPPSSDTRPMVGTYDRGHGGGVERPSNRYCCWSLHCHHTGWRWIPHQCHSGVLVSDDGQLARPSPLLG